MTNLLTSLMTNLMPLIKLVIKVVVKQSGPPTRHMVKNYMHVPSRRSLKPLLLKPLQGFREWCSDGALSRCFCGALLVLLFYVN